MIWNNCYGHFCPEDGSLEIGNDRIRKVMRLKDGSIATGSIEDLENSVRWTGDGHLWQRCPVLEPDEVPAVGWEATVCNNLPGTRPHLCGVLTLTGRMGRVWMEYRVFPSIPFVFSQTFVERESPAGSSSQAGEAVLEATGIESQYQNQNEENLFCSADTLDCIPLGRRHLKLETLTFHDKTDRHDSLLERQTVPLYPRGHLEREGNLFHLMDYPHGDSLLLVKHAPTASSALHRLGPDLMAEGNRYAALLGSGIDYEHLPAGRVPCYASAVGVAKTTAIWDAFWAYSTAFSTGDPRHSLFMMSNTWGDRSQDSAVCEEFLLAELEEAHRLGIQILQIDAGWQKGVTANSKQHTGGVWEGYYQFDPDFWQVNPGRFPRGLEPVVERARDYGVEMGLWFSPDSSREFANVERDIETLWGLFQRYGIRYFKLDGVKIRSKLCEMRFIQLLDTLSRRSGGEIRFNLDVTAEDRFGYLYQPQYGTLFVENRYTDFGNYYPHNTFRNLWSLASVLPARRLQMELLNPRRNPERYEGMPFPPAAYDMDYLFATVMPANPLFWMELSHLAPEDAAALQPLTALYHTWAPELFDARVIPIGDCPDGMQFSGYCCLSPDKRQGHLLLFREETEPAEHSFRLPVSLDGTGLTVLYQSAPAEIQPQGEEIRVAFSRQRSFVWLRFA